VCYFVNSNAVCCYSYDENAEQHCESAIEKALSIDPSSVDANHALANIRLSQSKPIEASELGVWSCSSVNP